MKIEKINDNQIRCIVTHQELEKRNIILNDINYSSKALKALINEMLSQAHQKFGFESQGTPLMIEAIPTKDKDIILSVTKMSDTDELDIKFPRITNDAEHSPFMTISNMEKQESPKMPIIHINHDIFQFDNINDLIKIATLIEPKYQGQSSLHVSKDKSSYILEIRANKKYSKEFQQLVNLMLEYGTQCNLQFFKLKHNYETLISKNAIKKLSLKKGE